VFAVSLGLPVLSHYFGQFRKKRSESAAPALERGDGLDD
jgi:hypothetical protein